MKDVIIETLRKHPEGLTFKDISDLVGHHRHTITKYVYELIGAQVIVQRDIGAAKLCYLKSCYNGSRLKSQAQLLTILFFLLLLPTAIIVAQNASVTTGNLAGMVTAIDNTEKYLNDSYSPDAVNIISEENITNQNQMHSDETALENNVTEIVENVTIEITSPENATAGQEDNSTEINNTEHNFTEENITGLSIETNKTEITTPEENITGATAAEGPLQPAEPDISVQIIASEKVTRGEMIVLRAEINNPGADAHNVVLEWILPEHFVITEGRGTENIGDLAAGSSFTSEIAVLGTADAALGPGEIKLRASYV
jgi:hypothetical protein